MGRRTKVVMVVALAAGLFVGGGLGLGRTFRADVPPAPPATGRALASSPVVASRDLASLIAALEARVEAVPEDWRAHADLGMAYVQQVRVTGDPGPYRRAEDTLRRSLSLRPEGNFEALVGMSALWAGRHDFAAALGWAVRARAVNPHSAVSHAAVGDALVELGRYEEAFEVFQRAVDLRPGLPTYARIAFVLELQGDLAAATQVMELARSAAGTPADAAWATLELGELAWTSGDLASAEALYRRALQLEGLAEARAGLAEVAAARGRTEEALAAFRALVGEQPSPGLLAELADLLIAEGRMEEAERVLAEADRRTLALRDHGVNVDLELALLRADRGRGAEAVAAAQAEWARRRSVEVADAMAWALHAAGRDEEALRYANLALRLGTRSPLFLFHRGVINEALGRDGAARADLSAALALNPHFSPRWGPQAAAILEALAGPA